MEVLLNSPLFCVLVIVCGLACLFLELFIPSGGILGIVGCAGAVIGIYGFFHQGLILVGVGAIAATVVFVVFAVKFWLGRVSFKAALTPETSTGADLSKSEHLGKRGVAQTQLRPAGTALINGRKVDVVSRGSFIPQGTPIEVIDVSGNRVVVRAAEDAAETEADVAS